MFVCEFVRICVCVLAYLHPCQTWIPMCIAVGCPELFTKPGIVDVYHCILMLRESKYIGGNKLTSKNDGNYTILKLESVLT